jgi:predicted RNA binding protein YcfA (HicA-like mRNA interferase family)
MKLPRDFSGEDFAHLLSRHFQDKRLRQKGSHLRMTSDFMGIGHQITIPLHEALKPGMLNALLVEVAAYLKMDKKTLAEKIFE